MEFFYIGVIALPVLIGFALLLGIVFSRRTQYRRAHASVAATAAPHQSNDGWRLPQWALPGAAMIILAGIVLWAVQSFGGEKLFGDIAHSTGSVGGAVIALFLLLFVMTTIGIIRWNDAKNLTIWGIVIALLLVLFGPVDVVGAARNKFQSMVSESARQDTFGKTVTAPVNDWSRQIRVANGQCVRWHSTNAAHEGTYEVRLYDYAVHGWVPYEPGKTYRIGAVAFLSKVGTPVEIAYAVMPSQSDFCNGL